MMRPIEELSILRNIVNQLDTATFGDPGVLIQPVLLVQPPRSRPPLKRDIERRIASAEVLHEGLNHGIQALTKLRDKWQAHKIALLAMLSPICSLPPEIVGEIFRHTVSQNWKHLGSIMLVSKQWHELATSHRGLWSHLRVSRHQIPILHRPLSYSKDYPLHLDIEHSDINPSLVSEGVFPASLAIQERLESATLTYDAELRQNLLTSIMHSTNVGYPKLRRLGVTNPLSTRHDGILNINYPTPRLEDLALKGVMARFFPSNRPRGVTRLLVSSVACSIRDLAGLLNISPHLKSIHFSSLKLSGIRHSPPPAIPALLSSLRTLTITQSELSNLAAVLQRFQAPNLESMTLDFENVIRPENADHISALRSFLLNCQDLRTLKLSGPSLLLDRIMRELAEEDYCNYPLSSLTVLTLHTTPHFPTAPYMRFKRNPEFVLETALGSLLKRHSLHGKTKVLENLKIPWCEVGYSRVVKVLERYSTTVLLENCECQEKTRGVASSSSSLVGVSP